MTIHHILTTYPQKLRSDSPSLDVELILGAVLHRSKEYLFAHSEERLTAMQYIRFWFLFLKRRMGYPVAYLTGHQYFYGLNLIVNKHVLVPRPETELLVEEVLDFLSSDKAKHTADDSVIIDLGVGSGAILVALAHTVTQKYPNDSVIYLGTDLSPKALQIALLNAQKYDVYNAITLFHGDLLEPLEGALSKNKEKKMIITANLPYLDSTSMAEPSIRKEPKKALYGGRDGLELYRELFAQIISYNIKPQALFLEIAEDQGESIKEIVKKALPEYTIAIHKDLCGLDRVVIITK